MQLRHTGLTFLLFVSFGLVPAVRADDEASERFFAAARAGDLTTIKKMVADGVDVNAASEYGSTALSFAADKGHVDQPASKAARIPV